MTTILVVEDDGATAEFLVSVLREAGYHVVQVGDGQAALTLLAQIRPQLVLFDTKLPLVGGVTLDQTLAAGAEYQAIARVVMRSGDGDGVTLPEGTTVLSKPFTSAVLLATVQQQVR